MSKLRLHHSLGWSIAGALTVLLMGAIGVGAITYERAYDDRMFPGVHIGPIAVGGRTRAEAIAAVQTAVDAFLQNGIAFALVTKVVTLEPAVRAQDPDLSYSWADVDVVGLVDQAFAIGRRNGTTTNWSDRVRGALGDDTALSIHATIDADRLGRALMETLGGDLTPVQPPRIVPQRGAEGISWLITDGRPGERIDIAAAVEEVTARIRHLDPAPVTVTIVRESPTLSVTALRAVLPMFETAIQRAPIRLAIPNSERPARSGPHEWTIDASTLAEWLTVDAIGAPTLNQPSIETFLTSITTSVEQPAEDARLIVDPATQRVREFRPARDGLRIDRDELRRRLHDAVFAARPPLVPIPLAIAEPAIALRDTNDLGIHELLGTGRTSFAGSPKNRRHNISVGAGLLNGRLITPGEEFSTVAALGPFNASIGYLPELVIKGHRTIPEYGGGLCQVSTTLFRTVLAAGLPVTERTNHAYRVPYYEPPIGMDATIYGPKPDFKFRNDTGKHLLLLTRIEGSELVYELWGTNDGRAAATTEPEVFNFVKPPPLREVETEDLQPGERKCTERAHTGADAKFTYTITYADGRKAEREFRSHYRPWQAVCLIGKQRSDREAAIPSEADGPAESRNPLQPQNTGSSTPTPDNLTVGGSD